MKKMIIVSIVLACVAAPAMAQCRRVYVTPPRPVSFYSRPVVTVRPMCYGPRYVQPVYQPAPMVVQQVPQQVVVQPAPVMMTTHPVTMPGGQVVQVPDGFVQTGIRIHGSGSDKGLVDWLKGRLNGRLVTIDYQDDGNIDEVD